MSVGIISGTSHFDRFTESIGIKGSLSSSVVINDPDKSTMQPIFQACVIAHGGNTSEEGATGSAKASVTGTSTTSGGKTDPPTKS